MEKVIIIGSGPAGMTAGIYTARADLNPLIAAGVQWGGLLMWTTEVENYPGYPQGIMGPELMQKMREQAEKFGARFVMDDVRAVDFSTQPYKVQIGDTWYETQSIIIGAGTKPRTLKLPREKEFIGRGLSVCATCDAAFFRGKTVTVIGGGDSAMEESLFLTKFANKVYLLVRSGEVKASKIMFERVSKNEKIEVRYFTEVVEYLGETKLEGVKILNNQTQEQSEIATDGLFFAIGHVPATTVFEGQLKTDELGFLVCHKQMMTEKEGIFACGDIEDKTYRQAVVAAGEGCKAAIDTIRWLQEKEE